MNSDSLKHKLAEIESEIKAIAGYDIDHSDRWTSCPEQRDKVRLLLDSRREILNEMFLRRILEATDATIVISSSWRYAHRLGSLRMMWEVRELPGEIIGTIPCGATYISRGEEIECWLDEHGRPDYVIIDDLDDFSPAQHDRYIETNPILGITEADARKAIEILTSKV